jgi:hypothetical protein
MKLITLFYLFIIRKNEYILIIYIILFIRSIRINSLIVIFPLISEGKKYNLYKIHHQF